MLRSAFKTHAVDFIALSGWFQRINYVFLACSIKRLREIRVVQYFFYFAVYFEFETELILSLKLESSVASAGESVEGHKLPILCALPVLDQPPLPGLGAAFVEESVVAEVDSFALEET